MAVGSANGMWKGERAGYAAAHMWMAYHFGRPQFCENCGTTERRMYHWANVSGQHKRDRSDWLRLCVPCHKSHDIQALGGKIKARLPMLQPTKSCLDCGTEIMKNRKYSKAQWAAKVRCNPCSIKAAAIKNLGNTNACRG